MSGYKAARVTFVIINILFFLMGIAMLGIGVFLKVSRGEYINLVSDDDLNTATALMIAAGIIVLIVAFFGFCGAWMENQCMLLLYFVCVLVIFAIEIAAGVIGLLYKGQLEEKLVEKLREGMKDESRRKSWDFVHEEHQCCGIYNYTDWYGILDKTDPNVIPDSCCGYDTCGLLGGQNGAYVEGCYTQAVTWIKDNYIILGIGGLLLGFLQIIMMIVSLALLWCLRQHNNKMAV